MNRLYFGDNLKWLSDRKEFLDARADLVYLDLVALAMIIATVIFSRGQ